MLIDCDTCLMRDTDVCDDCVVGVLLTSGPVDLDPVERRALDLLADAGLVPRLRLVSDAPPGGPSARSA